MSETPFAENTPPEPVLADTPVQISTSDETPETDITEPRETELQKMRREIMEELRKEFHGDGSGDGTVPANHGTADAANSTEFAPDYYVHLANGDTITTKDSGSTHMDVDGVSVQVIGRYAVGA